MAQRKSKQAKAEIAAIAVKMRELEESAKVLQANAEELSNAAIRAEEEEVEQLKSINRQIDKISKNNGVFCGVILTYEDILNILSIAIKSGENVKIGCKVYFNDNTE